MLYTDGMYTIDQKFLDFSVKAYFPKTREVGERCLADYAGKWLILFFYPADFTFVCPTELADMAKSHAEFEAMNAEILAVSCDTEFTHKAWLETEQLLKDVQYPMGADHNGKLSSELGIYYEEKGMAQRAVFIIDPDGVLRAVDIVSDGIGRSAQEIMRKLKALEYVMSHPEQVCPMDWEETGTITKGIEKAGKVYEELQSSSDAR
jgi:alkyl hydroperoxide reductase subunit AhpC